MERIRIGIITKPQALKGEFRVKPEILNVKKLKKLTSVFIDNKELKVEKVTLRDTFVIFKIESIDTCEKAETLRQKEIYADMEIEVAESLDLVDFEVFMEGVLLGKVIDINNYGSKDILSISGSRPFMVPVIDGLIKSQDIDKKSIELNKEIFAEVVVYED